MTTVRAICLVGCGSVFEAIAQEPMAYIPGIAWTLRRVDSVAQLAESVPTLLDGLDSTATDVFVAVDQNALNYARLELYGAARLRGLKLATLVHARAWSAPDARLDDNVWLGAGVLVSSGVHLASDVLVHPGGRIDAGARIGMHCWIGPGATIGAQAQIGAHSVVGADTYIRAATQLGKHCVVDRPGSWSQSMAAGSFIEPQFATPAHLIGAGYSHQRRG
jgi:carbonic anhydrase/acetyltransferase-like protein (isoleucine patch superfamily)